MRQWWQTRTLRFRLALWYTCGGVVLLAGFSATLYFYVDDRLAQPFDVHLQRDLADIRNRLAVGEDNTLFWDNRAISSAPPRNEYPWFELWDEHGKLIYRFWPFTDDRVQTTPAAPNRGRDTISVFSVAPDIRLRVLSVPYKEGKKDWMIRVMRIHEPAGDALGALRWIIAISLPAVVALLVVGGYTITKRWLAPLDRIASEAEGITAGDLGRRLPNTNPHDELGRLTTVFNNTLDRLERSFVALDRFVADASHELRTPLTTLRSVGEVGLRRSRTVEEYREIIGSMLEETQRLEALIQRLLELATAESGAYGGHRFHVRLDEAIAPWIVDLGVLAENKRQHLSLEALPCTAHTDPVILRQALQNLVDNAIKYSPEGGTIRVTVRDLDPWCEVTVTDNGPGIPAVDRAGLAERFFRPGSGRDRGSGGFGLGLAITKAYMRVLGGSLVCEAAEPRGSTFRLLLPKA